MTDTHTNPKNETETQNGGWEDPGFLIYEPYEVWEAQAVCLGVLFFALWITLTYLGFKI